MLPKLTPLVIPAERNPYLSVLPGYTPGPRRRAHQTDTLHSDKVTSQTAIKATFSKNRHFKLFLC